MTWSIVARDPQTGAFGVAVTTCFFAVGSLCSFAEGGVGAVATQAMVNPMLGPHGLRLLAEGMPAAAAIPILIAGDLGRAHRQVHLVDRNGGTAAYTGEACIDWCGHESGENWSVAGNMLAGPAVVSATRAAFLAASGSLAERMIAALDAGQADGGDKRGKQSAALRICSTETYPDLDLRVDDHAEPLIELRRLIQLGRRYEPFRRLVPSRARPSGIYDPEEMAAVRAKLIAEFKPG